MNRNKQALERTSKLPVYTTSHEGCTIVVQLLAGLASDLHSSLIEQILFMLTVNDLLLYCLGVALKKFYIFYYTV